MSLSTTEEAPIVEALSPVSLSPEQVENLRQQLLAEIPSFSVGTIAAARPTDLRGQINAAVTAAMDCALVLYAFGEGVQPAPRAESQSGRRWNVVEQTEPVEVEFRGKRYTGWTVLMMQEVTDPLNDPCALWRYDDL